ncbi:Hypothetical protein PHPALM_14470 [Phytophthora palmivora]|uniref:Uncharacterized protein n=1 Tax=Phytophthora palmivora TaxID=4796 RepID=A0A2P4XUL0_9STRA|nr:Hypothetical protein PHPALM_14470 [Phytophthora palmivora]
MEGGYIDGVRLLILFQRLIDNLGVAKLIRRETTGYYSMLMIGATSRNNCKGFRTSLVSEKNPLRHKLSVKRDQMKFRKRLLQDQGPALVMRSLEGRTTCDLVALSHFVNLRASMLSNRITPLLGELSNISGVFHAGRASPLQLTVSSSLNGGIGPTPKPIFAKIVYDFFLVKFGTRFGVERMLHDVFSNCRSLVRTDSLVLLFSHRCCMTNSYREYRSLGQNEALPLLHAIFLCGLNNFRLINVVPISRSDETIRSSSSIPSVTIQSDFITIDVVETILQTAFSHFNSD